jgi:hypothetical protein
VVALAHASSGSRSFGMDRRAFSRIGLRAATIGGPSRSCARSCERSSPRCWECRTRPARRDALHAAHVRGTPNVAHSVLTPSILPIDAILFSLHSASASGYELAGLREHPAIRRSGVGCLDAHGRAWPELVGAAHGNLIARSQIPKYFSQRA